MPIRKGSKGALRREKARESSDERKSERKAVGRLCRKGKAPSPTWGVIKGYNSTKGVPSRGGQVREKNFPSIYIFFHEGKGVTEVKRRSERENVVFSL